MTTPADLGASPASPEARTRPTSTTVLAFDVGGTKLAAALVSGEGRILVR
ncbi:MAG: hypothetical protein QOF96_2446, partial [Actinomycetota bacterium]|nr:hypothetical protein [Actinomycetota bacterium]